MGYFRRISPVGAYRDLRLFLSHRQRHELGFLALAVAATGFCIYAFAHDSSFERPYKRDIIYVQQWPADRTDAEIRAQQKIDGVEQTKRIAEQQAREAKLRAQFKKVDDQLNKWGI